MPKRFTCKTMHLSACVHTVPLLISIVKVVLLWHFVYHNFEKEWFQITEWNVEKKWAIMLGTHGMASYFQPFNIHLKKKPNWPDFWSCLSCSVLQLSLPSLFWHPQSVLLFYYQQLAINLLHKDHQPEIGTVTHLWWTLGGNFINQQKSRLGQKMKMPLNQLILLGYCVCLWRYV